MINVIRSRFVLCLFEEERGEERGAEDEVVDDVVDVSLINQENVVVGSLDFGMFVVRGEEMFADFSYRFVPRRDRGLFLLGFQFGHRHSHCLCEIWCHGVVGIIKSNNQQR